MFVEAQITRLADKEAGTNKWANSEKWGVWMKNPFETNIAFILSYCWSTSSSCWVVKRDIVLLYPLFMVHESPSYVWVFPMIPCYCYCDHFLLFGWWKPEAWCLNIGMGSQILLQRASLLLAGLALAIALALLGWRIYDQVEDTMKILMTTVNIFCF